MERHKWTSRKFWLAAIAMIYTAAATLGFDVPIEEVVVVDAVAGLWILIEGIIDIFKK